MEVTAGQLPTDLRYAALAPRKVVFEEALDDAPISRLRSGAPCSATNGKKHAFPANVVQHQAVLSTAMRFRACGERLKLGFAVGTFEAIGFVADHPNIAPDVTQRGVNPVKRRGEGCSFATSLKRNPQDRARRRNGYIGDRQVERETPAPSPIPRPLYQSPIRSRSSFRAEIAAHVSGVAGAACRPLGSAFVL